MSGLFMKLSEKAELFALRILMDLETYSRLHFFENQIYLPRDESQVEYRESGINKGT